MKRIILFSVLLSSIYITNGICQENSIQEQALKLFSQGKYTEALVKFKNLKTMFPKDPKYFYYSGICMVESNTTLDEAIKDLMYSSTFTVPRDVYFYIGKANHLSYKFSEALSYYEKFKNFGDKKRIDELQTDMYLIMAKNGLNISSQASIKVFAKDTINIDQVYAWYNKHLNNGAFKEKPDTWVKMWVSGKEKFYSYIPSFSPVGISVYTSSNSAFKRNKDIYSIKKISDKQWSKPEKLGASINSSNDEDYVYFNESEATLYFASMGHNSIGGYDIFKAVYNPDYKTWSAPINLGYPINSPYDDFLFVPDDSLSKVWFVSNRETSGKKAIVYQIGYQKEYTYSAIGSDFVFSNKLEITEPVQGKSIKAEKIPEEMKKPLQVDSTASIKTGIVYNKPASANNYPEVLTGQSKYNETLNNALNYQVKSDSISRIIEDKRELLANEKTDAAKTKLRSDIWALDKQAKSTQLKADSLYAIARQYEHKNDKKQEAPAIATTEVAKNTPQTNNERITVETPKNKKGNEQKKKRIIYEFKVMSKSPYKTIDEIPMDQPLPNGVIYRIQMGVFSKPLLPDHFKGIVPISGEILKNGEIKKYYAGLFNRMADAEKALNKIREYGFKDAYIVSYFDGKSIVTSRANELELSQ